MRRLISRIGAFFLALALTADLQAQVGPVPGYGPLPFFKAPAGCGTPSVTNIGATLVGGASATVTITGATVPAGSLIVVVVTELNATVAGTMSDGTNTYSTATRSNTGSGISEIITFYSANVAGLSGATLTYTRNNSAGGGAAISAFYASNIAASSPLDTAVTATASGTSTTPSVTSGTPAQTGELFVGDAGWGTATTFTEDTGNGWAVPPNTTGASTIIGGGNQVNAGTGTKIFAPTLGTSTSWGASIVGFKHC